MDQTPQIIKYADLTYGSSDNTNQAFTSAGCELNFANGGSILKPIEQFAYAIPQTQYWKEEVGLFGAENIFIRYRLELLPNSTNVCIPEPGWRCLNQRPDEEKDPQYKGAVITAEEDILTAPWHPARYVEDTLPTFRGEPPFVKIELINKKTGNIYNDDWLDVRLYTQDKREHPYNIMWMPNNEYFYVGFHARNTRRLPIDVELKIGYGYANADAIENKEYIRELIAFGNRN